MRTVRSSLVWLLIGSGVLLGGGTTVLLLVRRNREDGPAGPQTPPAPLPPLPPLPPPALMTPWPARIEAEELGVGYGWDG